MNTEKQFDVSLTGCECYMSKSGVMILKTKTGVMYQLVEVQK